MTIDQGSEVKGEVLKKFIPLVKYIASRVIIGKSRYIEYEDLISYGMIGLIDAFNKFDSSKGMKFSSYASIRIKGAMIDELRKNSPISKGAMDKLNRYNLAIEELQKRFLKEPSTEEIASSLGISISEVGEIEGYINYISVMSLENLIYTEDDDMPLIGSVEDKMSPSPEKSLEEKEQLEYLAKALDMINEKDKTVLTLYYYEGLTLKQIGLILEVSESRICQLHSRAIMHLKKELQKLKYK
ncbi:MAG: FliA/WhiG family RNA polymerase sigma factor [Clostridiaceae bacterium]|nr:FliA/WhiG family RNA polymerase sigma factor [Clostridiaceae bacterium]